MINCAHTFHPLIHQAGISQSQRLLRELDPTTIKIDGRSTSDLMDFVAKMASQVNHFDNTLTIGDWGSFFAQSVPFLSARIASINPIDFPKEHQKISDLILEDPRVDHLQWMVDFMYSEMIKPWISWDQTLSASNSSLSLQISKLISGELSGELKDFIALVNGGARHFSLRKPNFEAFLAEENWDLDFNGLFAIDDSFVHAPGGVNGRILTFKSKLDEIFIGFLESIKLIQAHAASDDFQRSGIFSLSEKLDKQHPAHLGLFFTYVQLYRDFQTGLNELSAKHLNYFYKDVLCLQPKSPIPDQAHILFELQKQVVQSYPLSDKTILKDGKDANGKDILFKLDEGIVVNKTKVADLKTLFLNFVDLYEDCDQPQKNLIEGAYIAPTANSLDGQGTGFEEDGSKSWPTLGSRSSKQLLPDSQITVDHPFGRIGLVLASPVLLLKEGKRTISVDLSLEAIADPGANFPSLDFQKLKDVLERDFHFLTQESIENATKDGLSPEATATLQNLIRQDTPHLIGTVPVFPGVASVDDRLNSLSGFAGQDTDLVKKHLVKKRAFKTSLSGAEEWIMPDDVTITFTEAPFNLHFEIVLPPELAAVTFFDEAILEEKLDTTLPVLKIELDQDVKISCEGAICQPGCCLEKCIPEQTVEISVYEFLKSFQITDTVINVEVCGVKDLIVQNEESVMDVNSLVFPWGSRPTKDSHFYIGNKEIFFKNWQKVYVNINWKDLPADFNVHYNGYQDKLKGIGAINKSDFKVEIDLLEEGLWKKDGPKSELFGPTDKADFCTHHEPYDFNFELERIDFPTSQYNAKENLKDSLKAYTIESRGGFLRFTLKDQDFQHERYPFVLARQMMAFGLWPKLIDGAIYIGLTQAQIDSGLAPGDFLNIDDIIDQILDSCQKANDVKADALDVMNDALDFLSTAVSGFASALSITTTRNDLISMFNRVCDNNADIKDIVEKGVVIPKEPYTPTIKEIALDYTAQALIEDIEFIHLYPYKDTFKTQDLQFKPALLPSHRQQGTLFVGLKDLTPGNNLNLLIQLAETTADSEVEQADIEWHYLRNNQWQELRNGFEILDDDTQGLTRSGIVKIGIPRDIALDKFSIMPEGLAWIKASVASNEAAVAEALGLHTQAVKTTFQIVQDVDTTRLKDPLAADSISKLQVADANIKQVSQPYDSFNGIAAIGNFHRRVSEHLRHKGRGITAFDYQAIVLEAFPSVYVAKCIQHTLALSSHRYIADLELAPGFVLLAVIPDPTNLIKEDRFAPRLPSSELTAIKNYLGQRISPFVRLKVENPRYEEVRIKLRVQLLAGIDQVFHEKKLQQEIRLFLSPWVEGDFSQLNFGRSISRSSLIKFIETREYVDYICSLEIKHAEDLNEACLPVAWSCNDPADPNENDSIGTKTARSILVAGEIKICPSLNEPCESYDPQSEFDCNQSITFHDCEKIGHEKCFDQ